MLRSFIEKAKYFAVTLRFSILSIFVTFFIIAMLTLIAFTYYRFSKSMITISFNLMRQASSSAFEQIVTEMNHTQLKCKSVARLFSLNVINPDKLLEIYHYTSNFIINEKSLFPSVQSIYWGDPTGDFIISQRHANGNVTSEIIDRSTNPPTHTFINQDVQGKLIDKTISNDISYDPRQRPWYQAAIKSKQPTWLGVYRFSHSNLLGMSVAAPAYNNDNVFNGVVSFNIRLDYLSRLVENIHLSAHGVLFIVTSDGKLLAYPGLVQYKNFALKNIDVLSSAAWVNESFNIYKKNGNQAFQFIYGNRIYLATYQKAGHYGSSDWLIGSVVPMADFIGPLRKTQIMTALFSLAILVLGIGVVSHLITRVVNPLRKIIDEIERIRDFDLAETKLIQSRIKEVSQISGALYSMKNGLRSFQKYVPATLVRQLIESGQDAKIGGVKKSIAVLFTDIANFTTITEQTDPELLARHLCEYFDELSTLITATRGTIDKYIGDAIMAFWGAPMPEEQPGKQAAIAAIACIKRLRELNTKWMLEGKPVLFTRIGIHLGDAIVGNLGSSERLNYTAIGDAINISSRLENINKLYGTEIIISDSVYQTIKDQFVTRMLDCVTLKGKSTSHYIYELIPDDRDQLNYDIDAYSRTFAQGFNAYKATLWDEAIRYFDKCLAIYPGDTVARLFINRCEKFKQSLPLEHWTGAWIIREK